jgi:hypothetical protein
MGIPMTPPVSATAASLRFPAETSRSRVHSSWRGGSCLLPSIVKGPSGVRVRITSLSPMPLARPFPTRCCQQDRIPEHVFLGADSPPALRPANSRHQAPRQPCDQHSPNAPNLPALRPANPTHPSEARMFNPRRPRRPAGSGYRTGATFRRCGASFNPGRALLHVPFYWKVDRLSSLSS